MGEYGKAESLYLLAMEINENLPPGGKHPDHAASLNNLAMLHEAMGEYFKAEALLLRSMEIRKSLPPAGKHSDYAATLNNLAGLYQEMENWKTAS